MDVHPGNELVTSPTGGWELVRNTERAAVAFEMSVDERSRCVMRVSMHCQYERGQKGRKEVDEPAACEADQVIPVFAATMASCPWWSTRNSFAPRREYSVSDATQMVATSAQ